MDSTRYFGTVPIDRLADGSAGRFGTRIRLRRFRHLALDCEIDVAGQVSVFQRLTSFGIAKLQGTAGATPQASHSVILHAPIIERGLCALQDVYNVLVDFRILNSSR